MELNPEHPVTRQLHEHWQAVCLLLMKKFDQTEVVITPLDVMKVEPNGEALVFQELKDGLHVRVVSMAQARELLRKEQELLNAAE